MTKSKTCIYITFVVLTTTLQCTNAVAATLTMGTMSANHTIHSSDTEVQSREQHVSQYYSPQQQQLTHTANDKPTPKSSDKKSQQVHRQVEKRTTEDSNRAHTQNDMLLFFPEIMKILMDRIEKAQARADASLGRLRQERRALEQARDDLKRILSRAVVASCSCTNARTCLSKRYKETQQQTIISPVGNESDDCTHRIRGATESNEKYHRQGSLIVRDMSRRIYPVSRHLTRYAPPAASAPFSGVLARIRREKDGTRTFSRRRRRCRCRIQP